MKTFDVKTMWTEYPGCVLIQDSYANNGHIALSIFSPSEGPIADLTVNIREVSEFPKYCSCVDTNDFPEAEAVISQLRIGKPTGLFMNSGFCSYPLYVFDLKALKEWSAE